MTPDTKELVDRALELLEKPMETTTTTKKSFTPIILRFLMTSIGSWWH
jgi:hypothetical protein